MASLDKLTLNNQIVLMRHDIRRAKLHTINKNVKECRRLNANHGSENKKEKNIRKRQRLLEEIKVIQKLNDDDVTKFLLTNQEDLLSIINNTNCEIKMKALAKIALNNIIKATLSEFKKKYTNWHAEVSHLLPTLGGKYQKKKKGKICEEPPLGGPINLQTKTDHKTGSKGYVVKTQGNNGFLVEEVTYKDKNLKETENNFKRAASTLKNEHTETPKTHKSSKNLERTKHKRQKSEVVLDNEVEMNPEVQHNVKKSEHTDDNKKVSDPFFVTADNREYMTVVTNEKQIEVFNKPLIEPYKERANSNFGFKNAFNDNKKFHHPKMSSNRNGFVGSKGNNRQERRFEKQHREESNNEVLHPSWEAKRKLSNISLNNFSGKKIVFGDD